MSLFDINLQKCEIKNNIIFYFVILLINLFRLFHLFEKQ